MRFLVMASLHPHGIACPHDTAVICTLTGKWPADNHKDRPASQLLQAKRAVTGRRLLWGGFSKHAKMSPFPTTGTQA
ncbi:MAG: hypothetical protein QMB92_04900, partial [Thiopseudomonas sp.]